MNTMWRQKVSLHGRLDLAVKAARLADLVHSKESVPLGMISVTRSKMVPCKRWSKVKVMSSRRRGNAKMCPGGCVHCPGAKKIQNGYNNIDMGVARLSSVSVALLRNMKNMQTDCTVIDAARPAKQSMIGPSEAR